MQHAVFALALSLGAVACAHEEELRPAEAPLFESAPPPAPVYQPPAAARPRLDHTVTLGEGDYSPAPAPPAPGTPGQAPNVTVNNNIYVQPSGYSYGSYGYGYGGYGGYAYRGGGSRVPATNGDGRTFVTPWRASGWEGAQRTAAPGQTPGVGGNWAPVHDSGPRQMK